MSEYNSMGPSGDKDLDKDRRKARISQNDPLDFLKTLFLI